MDRLSGIIIQMTSFLGKWLEKNGNSLRVQVSKHGSALKTAKVELESWKVLEIMGDDQVMTPKQFMRDLKASYHSSLLGGSIYATLNSAKPIPMEIRESTVRFQTFGQRDNYEAPPVPVPNYKKYRRKSGTSASPPDGMNLGTDSFSESIIKLKGII